MNAIPEESVHPSHPTRIKLDSTRLGITRKNSCGQWEFYVIVNFYEDDNHILGLPGEVFVHIAKEGSVVGGMCNALATTISLALQHGVPWSTLRRQYLEMRFEPNGASADGTREYPSIVHAVADTVDTILAYRASLWGTTDAAAVSGNVDGSGDVQGGFSVSRSPAEGSSAVAGSVQTSEGTSSAPTDNADNQLSAPVESQDSGTARADGVVSSPTEVSPASEPTATPKANTPPPTTYIGAGGRGMEPEIFEATDRPNNPQVGGVPFNSYAEGDKLMKGAAERAREEKDHA